MNEPIVKIARCECGQLVTLLQQPEDPPVCHECRMKRMQEELSVRVTLEAV